jgi:hypothetical protein
VTLLALVLSASAADPFVIAENDRTVAYACTPGASVSLAGNGNKVTLRGDCGGVNVAGNDNTLTIEGVRTISVAGNRNTVTWQRGAGRDPPRVDNTGNGNRISRRN